MTDTMTDPAIPDFDERPETPGAGHNQPPENVDPLIERLNELTVEERARLDALLAAMERIPAVIESEDIAKKVTDVTKMFKTAGRTLEAARTEAKRPINEQADKIQGFFNPLKAQIANAVEDLERRLGVYDRKKREAAEAEALRQREEAEARLAAARTEEEAQQIIDQTEQAQEAAAAAPKTRGQHGAQTVTRKTKKYRIVDVEKLPRQYMTPDEKKIAAAVKADIDIPGVETYVEETTHVR